ncbi:H(+)/Cl(-) exchange transporter ClcA [Rhodoferax lithotrophicus]|uniref:H(+)/Cl(-) exchange transporter ClcA n=1 Tax=Rhodoferax lithotrophicus TaxID=2798804 RepID=A0ABM7MH19_9BURK|nr:chloride channel protein [Rhodoferax sp. MIZ03]BCO25484.1 H(+)/Cl(-) exchange transporter ClcA [Rhodoferax sp. MIZ03]
MHANVNRDEILQAIRSEMVDWRVWAGRILVMAFAALAGLTVVAFTWMTELAFGAFEQVQHRYTWWPLIWTPLCTAAIVWVTRRYVIGTAGSGIPQVMAALDSRVAPTQRGLYVSLKLSLSKMALATWGLLAGLSLGREGPSVQIAAGVMHHARRWLPDKSQVSEHGLLMAGGAAGIAAAFNTPLGGVMFAIEELSRKPEQRSSGLLMAAIVLSGLMAVSVYGNSTYFGVIRVDNLSWGLLLPGLLVSVFCGLTGGLFARLLLVSIKGQSMDRFSQWRQRRPVAFAAACGLAVSVIGLVSQGQTFGSGYAHSRAMLEGHDDPHSLYVLLKFMATWLTAWAGVPGGIFAPALSIGGALGNDVAHLTHYANAPTLMALGMAGFLAAVTQAPLTAFIIVMEMVDGHALVLSLMATTMVASGVSRLLSVPLYGAQAQIQLQRLPKADQA